MKPLSRTAIVVLATWIAGGPSIADSGNERRLTLRFVPQETTGSSSPTLPEGATSRSVSLAFDDARPPSEISVVGEGENDDDEVFPWRATSSVRDFAAEVFLRTAREWGVSFDKGAGLVLSVRLKRFFVSETDQPVGSSYLAEVRVAYELEEAGGNILTSGVASGSARRYGRSRNADNCNEVLSDAMKRAYANLLDQPRLQAAWLGEESSPGAEMLSDRGEARDRSSSAAVSPGALLSEVVRLQGEGLGSDILISYIRQQVLTAPLTAEDLVHWKRAGLPESVIQAALDRSAALAHP